MLSASTVVGLTGACALLGDGAAADLLYRRLLPWAGQHLSAGPVYLGPADHHLGVLAATAGRWEQGAHHFRVALAHRLLGARPWQALALQANAGMLRGRGRPGDEAAAEQLDRDAAAIASPLGMDLPGWGRPTLGPRP